VYGLGYYEEEYGDERVPDAYLLQRGEEKELNIMVDTPRYSTRLAEMVEALGGARVLLHTHRRPTNIDSEKWCKRLLNSVRMIHAHDVDDVTRFAEIKLRGGSNMSWGMNKDIMVRTTPGLTAGHLCLQYRPPDGEAALFTGGMIRYNTTIEALTIPPQSAVFDQNKLIRSLRDVARAKFNWILPSGQGAHYYDEPVTGQEQIRELADSLEGEEKAATPEVRTIANTL